jgi:hypothetical protein
MYRLFIGMVLLSGVALLGGCGENFPRGKVSGKITYQGQPLTGTTMIFIGKDNMTYRAELNDQGAYSLDNIPLGQIKVAFQQALPQMPRKADPVLTGKGASEKKDDLVPPSQPIMPKFQLPAQYANPATSGVSFELKQPVQEWSIDLK